MERLSLAQTRQALAVVADLYTAPDHEEFVKRVLSRLGPLVDADAIAFNEVDYVNRVTKTWINPPDLNSPEDERTWAALCHEHPYLWHRLGTGRLEPVRLSDLTPSSRMSRTALWNELLAPKGLHHQLLNGLPSPAGMVNGFTICRSRRDYSDTERTLIALVHPHVIAAYRQATTLAARTEELSALARGVEDLGAALMVVADGRIVIATTRARAALAAYVPGWRPARRRLPEPLLSWIARESRVLDDERLPAPRQPLVLHRNGARLVVRLLAGGPSHVIVMKEYRDGRLAPAILEELGLTRREADVLAWLAEGKTNPEIATILGVSRRTVQTHLDRIYRRLGVETRTAAVALAYQTAALRAAAP